MNGAGKLLWGYYKAGDPPVWLPIQVDANGKVIVDMSAINLNDLADVSVAAPADGDIFYYDDATGLWKSKAHVDLTTGVHGVGASTIESVAGAQAKVAAHNTILSNLIHNNDNLFLGYGNESVIDPIQNAVVKIPALTAITDPASGLDVSDWYGAAGAYRQSDADSDATHIEDDDADFPASLQHTLVKWASDAAGTLNTGIGNVYIRIDSDTLEIRKFTGADFAGSYYYWIKHSEWVVPVTGIYYVKAAVLFLPSEADKRFECRIWYYTGTSAPVHAKTADRHAGERQ